MQLPVMELLERGRDQNFHTLLDVHERLVVSRDSGMRFAAGWAALYASQKTSIEGSDEAFGLATNTWQNVIEDPETIYGDCPLVIKTRAELCLSLAEQLRYERKEWSADSRLETSRKLGSIAAICLPHAAKGDQQMLGLLSEVAVMQLLWRPSAHFPMNVLPTSPAKDARKARFRAFNTDLYAYDSTCPTKVKGVNIQVKTKTGPGERKKYNERVVIVGAYQDFAPLHIKVPGAEKAAHNATLCIREANGEVLDKVSAKTLKQSTKNVHTKVFDMMLVKRSEFYKKVAAKAIAKGVEVEVAETTSEVPGQAGSLLRAFR